MIHFDQTSICGLPQILWDHNAAYFSFFLTWHLPVTKNALCERGNPVIKTDLKKLWMYVLESRDVRSVLERNRDYLRAGVYRVSDVGKRVIYIEDPHTQAFIRKSMLQLPRVSRIKARIKGVVNCAKRIRVVHSLKDARGSLIMVTRRKSVKIFDFERGIVVNRVQNKEIFGRIIDAHLELKKSFDTTILSFDSAENTYVEEYVDFLPHSQWTQKQKDECVLEIFRASSKHFESCKEGPVRFKTLGSLVSEARRTLVELPSWLQSLITEVEAEYSGLELPVIRVHGDATFSNILLFKRRYVFVDLESSQECFFFFDLMSFMVMEVVWRSGDYRYLNHYLSGGYDALFAEAFNVFGLSYDKTHRFLYVVLFVIERVVRFEVVENASVLDDVLARYHDMLAKLHQVI